MNLLTELQSSREVTVSARDAHRLARDGGWQQMPPALTPRVIVSRRQVLDAHGLTDEQIAYLQAMADVAWAERMGRWCMRVGTWAGIALALAASAIFFAALWSEFIP